MNDVHASSPLIYNFAFREKDAQFLEHNYHKVNKQIEENTIEEKGKKFYFLKVLLK
jgi:hypothetical protein